jgi:hypothetical protein
MPLPEVYDYVDNVVSGSSEGGVALIEKGVAEGESVVVDGQCLLKSNAHIRIKNPQ